MIRLLYVLYFYSLGMFMMEDMLQQFSGMKNLVLELNFGVKVMILKQLEKVLREHIIAQIC